MNRIINFIFCLITLLNFQKILVSSRDVNIALTDFNVGALNDQNIEIETLKKNRNFNQNNFYCKLNVNRDISKKSSPLFLDVKTKNFIRSNDKHGNIEIKKGKEILLSCPGKGNKLQNFNTNHIKITCTDSNYFQFPHGNKESIKNITCHKWPTSKLRKVGNCLGANTLYQAGFDVSSLGFIPLFEFCFNSNLASTLYTKFHLVKEATYGQRSVARPYWNAGDIYGKLPVGYLYTRKGQKRTFAKLLQSNELADRYIHDNDDYFLSRGHMVSKADFFYGAQQVNTFWYGNVAPQWQTFNGLNWQFVEIAVRNFAGKYNRDLDVYTGIFGNDVLPNRNGMKIPLSLGDNGRIPVPKMYWKVAHDKQRNLGIALIGLNSPYLNQNDIKDNILCNDICDKIDWLNLSSTQRHDPNQGYLYCCDVNDFRKSVTNIPNFEVVGILN